MESRRIQLTTDQLLSYPLFSKAVLERLDVYLPNLKAAKWRQIVSNLMKNSFTKEQAPEDASMTGQLMELVQVFLTRRQHSDNRDDVANGGVYVNGDNTAVFRSADLMEFLGQKRFTAYKAHDVYAALHDIGAGQTSFHVKGAFIRAWTLPLVNEQKEDYDTPEIPGGDLI